MPSLLHWPGDSRIFDLSPAQNQISPAWPISPAFGTKPPAKTRKSSAYTNVFQNNGEFSVYSPAELKLSCIILIKLRKSPAKCKISLK